MKIIGAVGFNGSGKDELVNYLHRRCGIPVLSAGDVVRDIAQKEGIPPTRDNLRDIAKRYIVRFGDDYFMKRLIKIIEENQWKVVGITGIRTISDVLSLKNHFGQDFILVNVEVCDPRIRYERTKRRGEARDPKTYEEFLQQDNAEEKVFKISQTMKYADMKISNDDTLEAFYGRIDESLIRQILSHECV
jgi:dephospho-CoA kinase